MTNKPTDKKEWENLLDHYEELKKSSSREIYLPIKIESMIFHITCDLFFDFSKIEFQIKLLNYWLIWLNQWI